MAVLAKQSVQERSGWHVGFACGREVLGTWPLKLEVIERNGDRLEKP